MFGTDEKEKELRRRSRALDERAEDIAIRESKVDQKIELNNANRAHEETIATIARQDRKLEEDQARRKAELEKELAQIELGHEHRMELLRAGEKLAEQRIAALEASNQAQLDCTEARLSSIREAHELVIQSKDEVISTLKTQLETVTEKLIAKLPNVNVNDITVVPQGGQGKGGDQKKDGQK